MKCAGSSTALKRLACLVADSRCPNYHNTNTARGAFHDYAIMCCNYYRCAADTAHTTNVLLIQVQDYISNQLFTGPPISLQTPAPGSAKATPAKVSDSKQSDHNAVQHECILTNSGIIALVGKCQSQAPSRQAPTSHDAWPS